MRGQSELGSDSLAKIHFQFDYLCNIFVILKRENEKKKESEKRKWKKVKKIKIFLKKPEIKKR